MKNFQEWLDCQTYGTHMRVLTQIKEQANSLKDPYRNRVLKTSSSCKGISNLSGPYTSGVRKKNSSLQSSLKEKELQKENFLIFNRLVSVSSVISKDKQVDSYHKNTSMLKKSGNKGSYAHLRAAKLYNYLKSGKQVSFFKRCKAIIKFKFHSIPFVGQGKLKTYWIEIVNGCQRVTSSNYSSDRICQQEIKIVLKRKVKNLITFFVRCSRGLDFIELGEYHLETQSLIGKSGKILDLVSVQDHRKRVSLEIEMEELQTRENYNFQQRLKK